MANIHGVGDYRPPARAARAVAVQRGGAGGFGGDVEAQEFILIVRPFIQLFISGNK